MQAPLEALGQMVRNRLRRAIAISRIAWPCVDVHNYRLAVGRDDGVAAKDLEAGGLLLPEDAAIIIQAAAANPLLK